MGSRDGGRASDEAEGTRCAAGPIRGGRRRARGLARDRPGGRGRRPDGATAWATAASTRRWRGCASHGARRAPDGTPWAPLKAATGAPQGPRRHRERLGAAAGPAPLADDAAGPHAPGRDLVRPEHRADGRRMRRACARLPCRPSAHREPGAADPGVDAGGAGDLPPAGGRGGPRHRGARPPLRVAPVVPSTPPGPAQSGRRPRPARRRGPPLDGLQPAGATPLQGQWRSDFRGLPPVALWKTINLLYTRTCFRYPAARPQRHSKTWSPSFLMPRTRRDGALNPCPRESRWGVPARTRPAGPQSIGLWSRTNLRPATSHGALAPVVVDKPSSNPNRIQPSPSGITPEAARAGVLGQPEHVGGELPPPGDRADASAVGVAPAVLPGAVGPDGDSKQVGGPGLAQPGPRATVPECRPELREGGPADGVERPARHGVHPLVFVSRASRARASGVRPARPGWAVKSPPVCRPQSPAER